MNFLYSFALSLSMLCYTLSATACCHQRALQRVRNGAASVKNCLKKPLVAFATWKKTRATEALFYALWAEKITEEQVLEEVRAAIAATADVNAAQHHGGTPIMYAAMLGYPRVAQLLLDAGADFDARDKGGETALHWAVLGISKDCVDPKVRAAVVQCLLEAGADASALSNDGYSVLQCAQNWNRFSSIDLLKQYGASAAVENRQDAYGDTQRSVVIATKEEIHKVMEDREALRREEGVAVSVIAPSQLGPAPTVSATATVTPGVTETKKQQ